MVEGKMQNVDGVLTIRAERIQSLNDTGARLASRSFQ